MNKTITFITITVSLQKYVQSLVKFNSKGNVSNFSVALVIPHNMRVLYIMTVLLYFS